MKKPVAFMSYAHRDDRDGNLTQLRQHLSDEVGVQIGEDFEIFQDRDTILWGQKWEKRIEESLDEVTFLIPIITPSFFKSSHCRDELQRFLEREKNLNRDDFILPIYYIDSLLLNDEAKQTTDELARVIAAHQHVDWRELRGEPFTSSEARKTLKRLANQIRDALEREEPRKTVNHISKRTRPDELYAKPMIIEVPSIIGQKNRALVTVLDPTNAATEAATEAYRTLRTNLLYAFVDAPPKVIVLTSPGPREGKSTICANLGVVLAQAGKRVLIADCDFRRPVMHKIFGLRNLWGIVSVLIGERGLQEIWHEPLPGLKVVTTGPIPPDPGVFLGSERFVRFLDQARQEFDYVLLDTPALELVSDVVVLAPRSDGALLVLDGQMLRKSSVMQSMRSLETVRVRVLGMVVNNAYHPEPSIISKLIEFVKRPDNSWLRTLGE